MDELRSVIIGTGCYLPESIVKNEAFEMAEFYEKNGTRVTGDGKDIVRKFKSITGIAERRYATPDQLTSDLGMLAATQALDSSGIDKETLGAIILAHNFGDVHPNGRISQVPSLASRVKAQLGIQSPDCIAYDILFGCPGWLQGVIQANYYIRSGDMKRCLVIGAETLSRVSDPSDRDSMIYSDGAGAVILEAAASNKNKGILSYTSKTYGEQASLLSTGKSYNPGCNGSDTIYLKMNGRKVYEFCLEHVPAAIQQVMKMANLSIEQVSKILVHQANEKMDQAILKGVLALYGNPTVPDDIMPMTIGELGNNSVATIPAMLDLILKGKLEGHSINPGDIVLMASVGAGMNINAIAYRF